MYLIDHDVINIARGARQHKQKVAGCRPEGTMNGVLQQCSRADSRLLRGVVCFDRTYEVPPSTDSIVPSIFSTCVVCWLVVGGVTRWYRVRACAGTRVRAGGRMRRRVVSIVLL